MKCKKCKKEIPEISNYCMFCGTDLKNQSKRKLYRRPDGLYEKSITKDGKRTVFRGRTEAEVYKQILEHTKKEEKGRLLVEVIDEYERTQLDKLTPNSQKGYKAAIKRLREEYPDTYVRDITPVEINRYIQRLASKGFARKTVTNHLIALNQILKLAFASGYIDSIPSENAIIPRGLKRTKRHMPSDEEIQKVKNSTSIPMGLLAYFILYSGLRRGEVCALTWGDISVTAKTIQVNKSAYTDAEGAHIKNPKTESGTRVVPLLDRLAEKLSPQKNKDLVFPDPEKGGIITDHRFQVLWRNYQKESGVTISPHQLRHGFATMLFEAGVSAKDAQAILGHASIEMTMDIYTEIRSQRLRVVSEQLNAYDY